MLQQSSVIIHGSAQIVLTNVLVRLAGNNFTARKGIITVKRGISVAVVEVAILANAFEGVRLDLGNLDPGKVQIRNNDGIDLHTTAGNFRTCDPVDGGLAVGCDIRATCSAPRNRSFDVQCSCEDSGLVAFNADLKDGSRCIQPQKFSVLTTTKQVQLEVKKPLDSASRFQVSAQGDVPFNVKVEVDYNRLSRETLFAVDGRLCCSHGSVDVDC